MQFILDKNGDTPLAEQAREQLLTALHMGKLRSGDRLPSVRQMALRNSINTKTAFTIYQQLKEEGYVELRAGAGAFVSDIEKTDLDQSYYLSVLRFIESNISQASELKLGPDRYAALVKNFIEKSGFNSVQVAIIECNNEQVNLFSREIANKLNVRVFPVLLDKLENPNDHLTNLLARMDYFITTDYHFKQVSELVAQYDKKTLQLRLDPNFLPTLIGAAQRSRLLMVVSDTGYFPAFRHRLMTVGTPLAAIENITVVDDTSLTRIRDAAQSAQAVYISPICHPRVREAIPDHIKVLEAGGMLSRESIQMLEAIILFNT